jgi:hypothetical protein
MYSIIPFFLISHLFPELILDIVPIIPTNHFPRRAMLCNRFYQIVEKSLRNSKTLILFVSLILSNFLSIKTFQKVAQKTFLISQKIKIDSTPLLERERGGAPLSGAEYCFEEP